MSQINLNRSNSSSRVAALGTAALLLVGLLPATSATATTLSSAAAIQDALCPSNGSGGTAKLTGSFRIGELSIDDGCVAVLDMNGVTFDISNVVLGAGSTLTVVDSSNKADGEMFVGYDNMGNPSTQSGVAGIRTTGATLVIESGNVIVSGGNEAAGIGGDSGQDGGTVIITGGFVVANGGGANDGGAGIGGGFEGRGGAVTISGGTVIAAGGPYAAGIGGGERDGGTVMISSGTVIATGGVRGAGIGGGWKGDGGLITISGGSVTATGGKQGAGIGGGNDADDAGTVTISGGEVIAIGGQSAAGIGGGEEGDGATVKISGGTVTATGGDRGAGIGGGSFGNGGMVTISGGRVTASGGDRASGIGGGNDGAGGTVTISSGTVIATGGVQASGIGGGGDDSGNGGTVTISGGSVVATAGHPDAKAIGAGSAEDSTDDGALTLGPGAVRVDSVTDGTLFPVTSITFVPVFVPVVDSSTPGPSFFAPGGVQPSQPVASAAFVRADGSPQPLAASAPGRDQVRYVADGIRVTLQGGPGTDVARGLVANPAGEIVCEVCVTGLTAGQVVEVWLFSTPRLVAAHLTDDAECQLFTVPLSSPLDGDGPVAAGAHTLQFTLATASGLEAVNVGMTVGGLVPTSVPAGEGPVTPYALVVLMLVVLLGIRRAAVTRA